MKGRSGAVGKQNSCLCIAEVYSPRDGASTAVSKPQMMLVHQDAANLGLSWVRKRTETRHTRYTQVTHTV
jgi:hypothetical protein